MRKLSKGYRENSSGKSTYPWGAPVLRVRVLDVSFPNLTSCCLSAIKVVIHWEMEVATEIWVSFGWENIRHDRIEGSNWSLQIRSLHNSQVYRGVAGCNAVPCWLHHPDLFASSANWKVDMLSAYLSGYGVWDWAFRFGSKKTFRLSTSCWFSTDYRGGVFYLVMFLRPVKTVTGSLAENSFFQLFRAAFFSPSDIFC